MKKITYFNVLVFTVLLLTMGGCNEDKFLKEDPRDALYPENLLVDYNGFKSMITFSRTDQFVRPAMMPRYDCEDEVDSEGRNNPEDDNFFRLHGPGFLYPIKVRAAINGRPGLI